jgi:translation initiation factor IF-1
LEARTDTGKPGSNLQLGVIEEVLPRALYRVRLEEGRAIRVGVDVNSRGGIVKLIAGDRVQVRLAERDPSRGQIVRKL